MAAIYARTVAVGRIRVRAGAMGCGAGMSRRGSVTGVLLRAAFVTAWFAAAGGLLAAAGGWLAACGEPTRNVYPKKPSAAMSASPSIAVQFRRRRSGAWAGVTSSSRLTADSTPGARWVA